MPRYDYRCHRCGETFEVKQKFSEEPLTIHEGCGGEVERLISVPTFQFKGTGWYVTDYARNNNSSPSNGAGANTESKTETKSETKTETKTESSPAPKPSSSDK